MKALRYYLILVLFICVNSVLSITVSAQDSGRLGVIIQQLKNADDSTVLVVAHRGDWRNAPENSIQAIKNCIKIGVDMVEIDVRMTKDSVLVLMHDETIDRTTNGNGRLENWTLDSLKTLTLKDACGGCGIPTRHKIPTLEEALLVCKGQILVNLDKASAYMDKAFDILKKTGTVDQAVFKGSENLTEVQDKYSTILPQIIYMPIITEYTQNLDQHVNDFLKHHKPVAFEVLYSSKDSKMFDQINKIHESGCRVWVNSLWPNMNAGHDDERAVDDPDGAWGWIIKNGASIIQTDRPALLLEYLREKGLHK